MTEDKVLKEANDWVRYAFSLNKIKAPESIDIRINRKLKHAAARATIKALTFGLITDTFNKIPRHMLMDVMLYLELNKSILNKPLKDRRYIYLHEACHLILFVKGDIKHQHEDRQYRELLLKCTSSCGNKIPK